MSMMLHNKQDGYVALYRPPNFYRSFQPIQYRYQLESVHVSINPQDVDIWSQGQKLNKSKRGLLDDATQYISMLYA